MSISCVQHGDVVQGLTNGMGPAALPQSKSRPKNQGGEHKQRGPKARATTSSKIMQDTQALPRKYPI